MTSGITITMNTPANINFFRVTPTSSVVNAQTSYLFNMTFAYQHFNNDRLEITIPNGVSVGSDFVCSTASTDYSVACFNNIPTQLLVRISYNIVGYSNSLAFTITNIRNYWLASVLTFSIRTTTNDTSFYYVESGSGTVNYQAVTLGVTVAKNNKIILTGQS